MYSYISFPNAGDDKHRALRPKKGIQYPLESWLELHAAGMDAELGGKTPASTGDGSKVV